MKYTVDAQGIHYEIETLFDADYPTVKPEIPMADAVESMHAIRDKQDAAEMRAVTVEVVSVQPAKFYFVNDDLCECAAQDAPTKCGACDG